MLARCGCDGLTATIAGEPMFIIACHCRDCQRRTGAPFGIGAYYDRGAVSLSGASVEYARTTDSGGTMRTRFCPVCATSLVWTIDAHPDLIAVAVGAMEDDLPNITVHSLWERSRRAGIVIECASEHHRAGYPAG